MNDDELKDRMTHVYEILRRETMLHWTRNGFFLLSSSIMLLAFNRFEDTIIMLVFGFIGVMLNIIWLMIQYRSSEYIKDWKNQIKRFEKDMDDKTYSEKARGYEMRKTSMLLPFPFIIIWLTITIQSICPHIQKYLD